MLSRYRISRDRLDQASDGLGAQIGQTRLWRLTFNHITIPNTGGIIECLIDGQRVAGRKANMCANVCVSKVSAHIILQEYVGGTAHNGKMWEDDPATFTGTTNSAALSSPAKEIRIRSLVRSA